MSSLADQHVDDILASDEAWFASKDGWHVILTKTLIGYQWTASKDGWPRRWGWRLTASNAEYAGRAAAYGYDRSRAAKVRRTKWNRDTRL